MLVSTALVAARSLISEAPRHERSLDAGGAGYVLNQLPNKNPCRSVAGRGRGFSRGGLNRGSPALLPFFSVF
jgi:hypothetical protein